MIQISCTSSYINRMLKSHLRRGVCRIHILKHYRRDPAEKRVIKWECQWIWLRSKASCSVWRLCCVKCCFLETQIVSQPLADRHFPTLGVWKHTLFSVCNTQVSGCNSAWGFRSTNPFQFPWDARSLSLQFWKSHSLCLGINTIWVCARMWAQIPVHRNWFPSCLL